MKKKKERRVYLPRVLGSGQVMMPADLKRLHKYMYMLDIERINHISDEMRAVVRKPQGSSSSGAHRTHDIGPRGFTLPFQIFRLLGQRGTE